MRSLCEEKNIKIAKFLTINKIKTSYRQFEDRRKLASSFNLFIADDRIVTKLSRYLGKPFFEKKKQPIPIAMERNIENQIKQVIFSTYHFVSAGCVSNIKVAKPDFTATEIGENIVSVLQNFPLSIEEIRSIYHTTSSSMSLPIYNSPFEISNKISIKRDGDEIENKTKKQKIDQLKDKSIEEKNGESNSNDQMERNDEFDPNNQTEKKIKVKKQNSGKLKKQRKEVSDSTPSKKKKKKFLDLE